jgi:methylenetetrahydrofolate dehydrogenase (NADP+)/methenyltetrahydrofolate cyclohydrolase
MTAQLIDGKQISQHIIEQVKLRVAARRDLGKRPPGLAVVRVGQDSASRIYVRNKLKACERCGVESFSHEVPDSISQRDLLALIDRLNSDPAVDGILVQLPLPNHIDSDAITNGIDPSKDVDGFHPYNLGRLMLGLTGLRPCTPRGVMTLLKSTGISIDGVDAVILGRSNIVGRPMALELLHAGATITICHSRTRELPEKVAQADLVVAALGKPRFVQGSWVKSGAIVVDVGINRLDDGSLAGDVDFETVRQRASWITPVPGGVGPMTVASLLENTLQAAENRDPASS